MDPLECLKSEKIMNGKYEDRFGFLRGLDCKCLKYPVKWLPSNFREELWFSADLSFDERA